MTEISTRPVVGATRTSVGHAVLYMAPMVVAGVLPLITLPIFTRILSSEDYGIWGVATACGSVVSSVAGLGLQVGFERNYFAAEDDQARRRLLYTVALFALAAQVVGLALLAGFGRLVAARLLDSPDRAYLLILAFVLYAVGGLKAFFLTTLRNEGRAGEYVRFSVDELFLGAGLSLGFVFVLRTGVVGLILGPLVASSVVFLLLAARVLKGIRPRFDAGQLRDTLRISLPLAPRALIGAVGNQLDRLVLGAVGSLAGVGVYTIAQRMGQFVFACMSALQNVYQPQVYRMLFAREQPSAIGRYLLPFAYGSAALAFGVIVMSREIVTLIAPPQYAAAAPILAVLGVYYGLMFFGKQPQLVFAKRTDVVSVLSVVSILANAGLVFAGARAFGAIGAAAGLLSAGVVTGAIGLYLSWRYAPINYPMPETVAVFGALPIGLALVLFLDAMNAPLPVAVPIKALAIATFAFIGWRSGLLGTLLRSRSALAK